MKITITTSLVHLLTVTSSSSAFHCHYYTNAHAYSTKYGFELNAASSNNQKKRRFLQTEHHNENSNHPNSNSNSDSNSGIAKSIRPVATTSSSSLVASKQRSKGMKMHPMVRKDLSLDDLENVMSKRWGGGSSSGDNNDSNKQSSGSGGIHDNERKVLQRVRRQQQYHQREYYDEDDEGYEVDDVTDDSNSSKYRFNDTEEEVGKSGSSSVGEGFFMRRQQQQNDDGPKSSISVSKVKEDEGTQVENKDGYHQRTNKKVTKASNTNKPKRLTVSLLLDEDGNEQIFNIAKAEEQTQRMIDLSPNSNQEGGIEFDSFVSVGITHPVLLENLEIMDCATPLPVQIKACPSIVEGKDVLIGTHTGSGKTLAFLTPLAERLLKGSSEIVDSKASSVRAIVVAPGRELASQIVSVARQLLQGTGLNVALSIGGTPFSRNVERIRKSKPDIIVGTPGRVAELVVGKDGEKKGKVRISSLSSLVLDEFDALLQYQAHREPTSAIVWATKRQKRDSLQTVLCSATAADMKPDDLENYLREDYIYAKTEDDVLVTQHKPTKVSLTTVHGVVHVPHRRLALETLRKILNTDPNPQQALVFVDNPRRAEIVVDKLADMGIIAASLHGGSGSEKGERTDVNRALRDGYVGIVVATEMAARGIDAPFLTHVINLDLPTDASHYAHRAGRCGRGGRPGVVVNFTTSPKERKVPRRFADALGIELHAVDPQKGLLKIVDEESALAATDQKLS